MREDMHDNTHIQTVAKDFFRSQKREPSISGTFDRLNVVDYKRAERSEKIRCIFEGCENLTIKNYHLRRGCKLSNEQLSDKLL